VAPTSQEGFGKRSRAWQLWDVLSTASSRLPSSTPQTGEFGQRRPGHGGEAQQFDRHLATLLSKALGKKDAMALRGTCFSALPNCSIGPTLIEMVIVIVALTPESIHNCCCRDMMVVRGNWSQRCTASDLV